jgi:hypothetical protein
MQYATTAMSHDNRATARKWVFSEVCTEANKNQLPLQVSLRKGFLGHGLKVMRAEAMVQLEAANQRGQTALDMEAEESIGLGSINR